MHIGGHFLHSAKRYQSGCPALRWQIPSLPPPPLTPEPSREGFPTVCSNRVRTADCFIQIVTASCVASCPQTRRLYRLINPAVTSPHSWLSPGKSVSGQTGLHQLLPETRRSARGHRGRSRTRAEDRSKLPFMKSSSTTRNQTMGCNTLTWGKQISILYMLF